MKIIAGPCQLERNSLGVARYCQNMAEKYGLEYYFKASFDKANRTSMGAKRGVGLESAMIIFDEIKAELGCKIVTDIHTTGQAALIKSSVDVLQIPAFLCRQTDLLLAAKNTGKIVNNWYDKMIFPLSAKIAMVVTMMISLAVTLLITGNWVLTFGIGVCMAVVIFWATRYPSDEWEYDFRVKQGRKIGWFK